ncbi:UDP-2,3-diacylglucosamine diphosphatase [Salinibacter altiplanensis]|uniref:UDP-2,3-diacylglucosamine diphosphatase n=1 Tax=Salinibacter altiplanensis TaxID=1803181 RepID=UPI000C9FC173|nr:UDP-2,3-diacylglucosamine diphosphatase [Salinibacter altiplanensis]
MVLFVSDMHFGRGARSAERKKEAALIECLKAHAADIDHLYLLGDVFDGYIEYRHLVPKGFVRFQGLLARWTDRGIPVTYLLGNHDPWHQDHFSKELGVTLIPDALETTHLGHRLYLAHGDGLAADPPRSWLRALLRHPVPVGLYRSLLPADVGLGLARWVSRRLHDRDEEDPTTPARLRAQAYRLLRQKAVDGVILGHGHVPALDRGPEGGYLNTGTWYERQTFARLDGEGLHLQRWNGARAQDIESVPL